MWLLVAPDVKIWVCERAVGVKSLDVSVGVCVYGVTYLQAVDECFFVFFYLS